MLDAGLLVFALALVFAAPPDTSPEGHVKDDSYVVEDVFGRVDTPTTPSSSSSSVPREFFRGPACVGGSPVGSGDACSPGVAPVVVCPGGMAVVPPLWMRVLGADGVWGEWESVSWYSCPSVADLRVLVEREWTALTPAPSGVSVQPDGGWVYGSVPTIGFVEDGVRRHEATLLGAAVVIEARPARFEWSWGDGEVTVTEDPGAPYPDETVTHTYGRVVDEASVVVSTTWEGRWRAGGDGQWEDFDTVVTTQSPPISLDVLHPRNRLISAD